MEYQNQNYKKPDERLKRNVEGLLELIVEGAENIQSIRNSTIHNSAYEKIGQTGLYEACNFEFLELIPIFEYSVKLDAFESKRQGTLRQIATQLHQDLKNWTKNLYNHTILAKNINDNLLEFYTKLSDAFAKKNSDFDYSKAFTDITNIMGKYGVLFSEINASKAVENALDLDRKLKKCFEENIYEFTPAYVRLHDGLKAINIRYLRNFEWQNFELGSELAGRLCKCIAKNGVAESTLKDIKKIIDGIEKRSAIYKPFIEELERALKKYDETSSKASDKRASQQPPFNKLRKMIEEGKLIETDKQNH